MIRVVRTTEPNGLARNRERWRANYLEAIEKYRLNSLGVNKRAVTLAENKYKHNDVKEGLKEMFSNKCAYCESHISHIGYGHIEHFKPKIKFPEECFNWENLFLSCEVCNGSQYKGEKFPDAPSGGPFVNPTEEEPFDFFNFEYDPETGTANVLGKNERGINTEKELGLNRPDLTKHRSKIVRRIVFIAIKAKKGDIEALNEMRRLIRPDEEYSAFSLQIYRQLELDE